MKIIVGLGNPGKKYEHTRHNIGWLALDYFLKNQDISSEQNKFGAIIKEVRRSDDKILFVYPQEFMNNSGKAVREIMAFYKLAPKDVFVVHDEVDLPLGVLRVSENSSSAGHNGIKSIFEELGTQEIRRLRIGVETRVDKAVPPTDAFVLQEFPPEELAQIPFEEISAQIEKEIE